MRPLTLIAILFLLLAPTATEAQRTKPKKADEPAVDGSRPDEPKAQVIDRTSDPAREKARRHNARAKKLFNLGLFEQAAVEYEKAYGAKPVPAFLFNLAQCHKRISRKKNIERAIFYFKSFLNNVPDTPMRVDIEDEIAKLRRGLATLERRDKKPAGKPFYKRWWFWTAVGAAVAGATVGTVIALQPEDMKPADTHDSFTVPMGN